MEVTGALEVTEGGLRTHWQFLNEELLELARVGGPQGEVQAVFIAESANALLVGPAAEFAARDRGRALALPLGCQSPRGVPYWVAYREEWVVIPRGKYRFNAANLTFFHGPIGEAKLQLFRAEWPGLAEWSEGKIGWQAEGAGHPHWQFDALQAYVSADARQRDVGRLLEVLSTGGIEEFGADDLPAVRELAFGDEEEVAWTRMHFASLARWSSLPWRGDAADIASHANAPDDPRDIRNWVTSVIYYAKHELG
jgi:hypothetical protein